MTDPLKRPQNNFTQEQGTFLEKYLKDLIKCCQANCLEKFTGMDKAVDAARLDMERRMKDFPEQFLKKGEVGEMLSRLSLKVETLEKESNKAEGKASVKSLEIVRWVSITGLALSAIGLVLRFFKI